MSQEDPPPSTQGRAVVSWGPPLMRIESVGDDLAIHCAGQELRLPHVAVTPWSWLAMLDWAWAAWGGR